MRKHNYHWYDGHLGALYYSESKLAEDKLYCEECGDSDRYIDNYSTWKDAYLGLVDNFSDSPDNYDSEEEYNEYYDPEYCMYDKKYICEKCNEGPITMENFIDIMELQNKKVLIQVRLWDKKTCREDDVDGVFAGHFVIKDGKYKFKSKVDGEEWDDMWNVPIKWFDKVNRNDYIKSQENLCGIDYDYVYTICFDLEGGQK